MVSPQFHASRNGTVAGGLDQLIHALADAWRTSKDATEDLGPRLAEVKEGTGLSWRQIAHVTGIPRSTAHRRARLHLTTKNGPGGGRNANRGLSQPLTSQEQP